MISWCQTAHRKHGLKAVILLRVYQKTIPRHVIVLFGQLPFDLKAIWMLCVIRETTLCSKING